MLLSGTGIEIDAQRFERDQHYAPVVWVEPDGRVHVAFGFHRTAGYHLATKQPGATDAGSGWPRFRSLCPTRKSTSSPMAGRLSISARAAHLGFWTYRTSADGGRSWDTPKSPVIDMDAPARVAAGVPRRL